MVLIALNLFQWFYIIIAIVESAKGEWNKAIWYLVWAVMASVFMVEERLKEAMKK